MQSIKEHNLKANHNRVSRLAQLSHLYAIYQRTQFESKSQQSLLRCLIVPFCMQSIKEHNLKANHNHTVVTATIEFSVCNLSKNTIWKQITTCWDLRIWTVPLYAIYQRTQFESKSQHNGAVNLFGSNLYAIYQRTQFESKSQLSGMVEYRPKNLYAIYQRTQFESKSQPLPVFCHGRVFCMQSIKEHNLKANHNLATWTEKSISSVCNLSKNTIWKQITTFNAL